MLRWLSLTHPPSSTRTRPLPATLVHQPARPSIPPSPLPRHGGKPARGHRGSSVPGVVETPTCTHALHLQLTHPPSCLPAYFDFLLPRAGQDSDLPAAPLFRFRFVLCFHVLDKTLSIWEPKRANSGIKGGTFLERIKVKKHEQVSTSTVSTSR